MVEFYTDQSREWRWRIKAENGEIVAASSESFASKVNAVNNLLMTHALIAAYVRKFYQSI